MKYSFSLFASLFAASVGITLANGYKLTLGGFDNGGGRNASADYAALGSLAQSSGDSLQAADYTFYLHVPGQIYNPVELRVAPVPASVAETSTRQMQATQRMDDDTTLPTAATEVNWEVVSGPISGIFAAGVATALTVYENTSASLRGTYQGQSGTSSLTVLDTIPDNYGTYAGDGLPDGWQVQYLGLNSTNGGPALDPDFDGLTNLIEYALNLSPVTSSSFQPTTAKNGSLFEYTYIRSKAAVTAGKLFQVEWSDTLVTLSWSSVGVVEEVLSDNGTVQQVKVTLPAGINGRRFVRLRVE